MATTARKTARTGGTASARDSKGEVSFSLERQKNSEWCWAAVTVSVDRLFRPAAERTQCQIVGRSLRKACCGAGEDSCNISGFLHEELQKLDLLSGEPIVKPISFAAVRREVNAGRPVCVLIKWRDKHGNVTNRGHFITIRGYSVTPSGRQFLTIADPLTGETSVDYSRFAHPDLGYQDGTGKWHATFLVKRPS
ncbi:MAG: C39 family peptidase [Acidobacteria bacterium]|nr:C39 family peptidase [Acidobacteriota bacterium]